MVSLDLAFRADQTEIGRWALAVTRESFAKKYFTHVHGCSTSALFHFDFAADVGVAIRRIDSFAREIC